MFCVVGMPIYFMLPTGLTLEYLYKLDGTFPVFNEAYEEKWKI